MNNFLGFLISFSGVGFIILLVVLQIKESNKKHEQFQKDINEFKPGESVRILDMAGEIGVIVERKMYVDYEASYFYGWRVKLNNGDIIVSNNLVKFQQEVKK